MYKGNIGDFCQKVCDYVYEKHGLLLRPKQSYRTDYTYFWTSEIPSEFPGSYAYEDENFEDNVYKAINYILQNAKRRGIIDEHQRDN